MERFDVAVIGAGPAGSTTAYRLADAGLSVVMLDRASFPRDKPCGGGLTIRGVRLLPFSVDPVVEHIVDHVAFRFRFDRGVEHHEPTGYVLMTQRRRLDHFLAEKAQEMGAELREGVRVRTIEAEDGRYVVRAGDTTVRADAVVGADGANGVTASQLALGGHIDHAVALEGNLPYDDAIRARFRRRAVLEIDTVPGGYGWVFPKGDHVNFGVGGWLREGPRLRQHLDRLCAAHGVAPERIESLRGWRLPVRRRATRLASGNALLVGDAAGMVDPLSGDGMYEAFATATHAASAIVDRLAGRSADLSGYDAIVRSSFARHVVMALGAKLVVDRAPRLAFAVAASSIGRRGLGRYLRGPRELPDPGSYGSPAWRAAEAVVRRAAREPLSRRA